MEEYEPVTVFEEDPSTENEAAETPGAAETPETPETPADEPENTGIIPVGEGEACPLEDGSCGGFNACQIGYIAAAIVVIAIIASLIGKCRSGKCNAKPQSDKYKPGGHKSSGKLVEIYVGNLSYDVDDALLLKQFTKFGVIKSARVVINRHNNKSKGYGFVEMPHREEAEIAIKKLNNHDLMGRPMKVNEARRDSRPPEKR